MTTRIQDIIIEHSPEIMFDRQLTPEEQQKTILNLKQAELYPQDEWAREQYVKDEVEYLKELNGEINYQQSQDLYECLEQDADFEPLEDEQD